MNQFKSMVLIILCYMIIRRKIKNSLISTNMPKTGMGRSENFFYFSCIFSFLKMGKNVETC